MARGSQIVIITGHLGGDPEVKVMASGNSVANFSVAVTEAWNDKQTQTQQSHTEWIRIVAFGKIAENAGKYLKKGSLVQVQGKMKTRKWQDQTGRDCYITEVHIGFDGKLEFLDRNPNQNNQGDYQQNQAQQQQPAPTYGGQTAEEGKQGFDDFDDDIPFWA